MSDSHGSGEIPRRGGTHSPPSATTLLPPAPFAAPSHGSFMAGTLVNGGDVILSSGARRSSDAKQQAHMIDMQIQKMRVTASIDDPIGDEEGYIDSSRRPGQQPAAYSSGSGHGATFPRGVVAGGVGMDGFPPEAVGIDEGGGIGGYEPEEEGDDGRGEGEMDDGGNIDYDMQDGIKNITWADQHGLALFEVRLCSASATASTLRTQMLE